MSADNGIYIAQFPDGFRVIEAMAIDNLNYFPEGTDEWKTEIDNYYGCAPIFDSFDKALIEANKLMNIVQMEYMMPVEYGIQNIGYFDYIPKEKHV